MPVVPPAFPRYLSVGASPKHQSITIPERQLCRIPAYVARDRLRIRNTFAVVYYTRTKGMFEGTMYYVGLLYYTKTFLIA